MNTRFRIALLFLPLLCLACVSSQKQTPAIGTCTLENGDRLILRGSTDAGMKACVASVLNAGIRHVEVNSPGGSMIDAMAIGELLAPNKPDIVVRHECSSSCANYLLPVARSVSLEQGARIVLHGSIDEVWRASTGNEIVDRQNKYVTSHGLMPGWLLLRDPANPKAGPSPEFVSGEPETWGKKVDIAFVIVEEPFLRSCLPGVEIAPFNDTLDQRIRGNKGLQDWYAAKNMFLTGSMRCLSK